MGNKPDGEYRMSGDQRIYEDCFNCGKHNKLYMNDDTGAYYCFSCEVRGCTNMAPTTGKLQQMLAPKPVSEGWPEARVPDYEPLGKMARRYLTNRGILRPEEFGMVQVRGEPRILIPYYGEYGRIIHWTTRSFMDDGKPKYITAPGRHPLYVLPEMGEYEDVVYVEGVFDAIIHWLATGIPTVALGGKSVGAHLRAEVLRVGQGKRTFVLDPDAVSNSIKLAQQYSGTVHILPAGTDPAEHWKEEAIEAQSCILNRDVGQDRKPSSQPVTATRL